MIPAVLLAALLLDAIFGEPRWLWSRVPHPAVLMGRAIDWGDHWFNRGPARRRNGAVFIAALGLGALGLGALIAALPLAPLWQVLIAAILIAQRSLTDHLAAVATGLRDGLPAGRRAVAMIVGRDTQDMDEAAIARAAIESGAENFSDGVVAPVFWFLTLGLPGIIFYKIVNTADSMIGHLTPRHEQFGEAAARLDDALNWIPARLTAVMFAAAFGDGSAFAAARRDGPKHRSPNAGWPEAALAAILGVALSGPRSYGGRVEDQPFANPAGRRDLKPADIDAAVAALWRAWALMAGLIALSLLAA